MSSQILYRKQNQNQNQRSSMASCEKKIKRDLLWMRIEYGRRDGWKITNAENKTEALECNGFDSNMVVERNGRMMDTYTPYISYKDSTDSRVSCVISTINCALICQSTVSLLHTIQLDQYNSNNQSSA
ncbi:hypothetical protein EYC84_008924 [Monilinia fructicola]|uniref:Uncharacterized protein n=1 Tax=Monilinia fructicola TaxID=38448 RepID=A0A5M9JCL4_MONFR|nr:hypothetical protein EYC84_008924 [Monilinia fructicola]